MRPYGNIEPDNIVDLPREIFQVDGVEATEALIVDSYISLTDKPWL